MGNLQVRFLEGWAPAMALGYSTLIALRQSSRLRETDPTSKASPPARKHRPVVLASSTRTPQAGLLTVLRDPRRSWIIGDEGASFGTKESVDLFVNGNGAFEIGGMSAVLQSDQVGIWNCLSDVLGCSGGDEFVVARDDEGQNP